MTNIETHYIYRGRDVEKIGNVQELREALKDCIEQNFRLNKLVRKKLPAVIDFESAP